ncbi:MAG TPA: hypothetical protein VF799_06190 [Geobacteraceae bacterium]
MKKALTVILCTLGLNACTAFHSLDSSLFYRQNQEKKLAAAIRLQKEGKTSSAMEALISLCGERGVAGVTDEALFRLSLLYLINGPESDKMSLQLAQQGFARLQKEYPSSPWTGMAEPVSEIVTTMTELRRQMQNCKSQNQALSKEGQTLSRENQELRQSIEKLKRLDLELEQKRK